MLPRDRRDGDEVAAVCLPVCILLRSEDLDFLVRRVAEGLQTFEGLLTVVETRSEAVDA